MSTSTQTPEDPLHYSIGVAVHVSITLKQLELIARKIRNDPTFTPLAEAELNNIADMIDTTVADPGLRGTLHGFAL